MKGCSFQSELESASYEVQVLVFVILKIVSAYCAFVKDIEVRPCVQQRACNPTGGNPAK